MQKDLIDYALPLMEAEKALKRVYDRMLEQRPEAGMEEALVAHRHLLDALVMIRKEILDKKKQIQVAGSPVSA